MALSASAVMSPPWTNPRLFACEAPALIARLTPRLEGRA
jgi:hypothetical protein